MGAIKGLEALKKTCPVELYTDSQYVRKGMIEWMANWKKNGWRNAKKEPVKNADLWQLLDQQAARHQVGSKGTRAIRKTNKPINWPTKLLMSCCKSWSFKKMRQLFLDTETTGIDPNSGHRIIEIACVELIDRELTGNHYHQYLNPQRKIDEGAFRVHGLSESFLQDKPLFSEIAPAFMAFIEDAELVIHNAPFDLSFLDAELKKIKWFACAKFKRVSIIQL